MKPLTPANTGGDVHPSSGTHTAELVRAVWSPYFGQRIENVMASEENPLRFGLFVEAVQRPKGGMNPGRWWRLTNGHDEFWLVPPANCRPALNDGHGGDSDG